MKLYCNNKIEVRKSDIHGFGVFAKEDIKEGEILEESHYIKITDFPEERVGKQLSKYVFGWPKSERNDIHHSRCKHKTLPLGNGCIYNSAPSDKEKNADWATNEYRNVFVFRAVKNIHADEEILTYYGSHVKRLLQSEWKRK